MNSDGQTLGVSRLEEGYLVGCGSLVVIPPSGDPQVCVLVWVPLAGPRQRSTQRPGQCNGYPYLQIPQVSPSYLSLLPFPAPI